MKQMSIFDGSTPFKITKPIRLIELFAGYGSQHLALKYLGVNVESYRICEWAVKSIQAYKDLHFGDDSTDYSADLTFEQIVEFLASKGISANYNDPMTLDQVKRMGEQKCRIVYNNIKATHNLVNIMQAKASDLNIVDTDKYCYIMTYSFPCQDLSKAGKGQGMAKDSGTRSGLLWEVERLLDECNGNLPQVLLMENVPDVVGSKNIKHFSAWLAKLESLGYKCYWKCLNAKNFGIPQNRERCFMVSILGDYFYNFPQPVKLEKQLKDFLVAQKDAGILSCTRPRCDCLGIVVAKDIKPCVRKNYIRDKDKIATSKKDIFVCDCTSGFQDNKVGIKLSPTIRAGNSHTAIYSNFVIRKLTPKECWRLMGVKDEDFEKVQGNQSNSSLYHLSGDSLVTTVMMAILCQILDVNWEENFNAKEWFDNEISI